MEQAKQTEGKVMGLIQILGIIFITLKLMGYIHWHWLIVLLPFLPTALLWLVRLAELFLVYVVMDEGKRERYLREKKMRQIFNDMGL